MKLPVRRKIGSTGGNPRRPGHITQTGQFELRFLLLEAAQATVRSLLQWRSKYRRLRMRCGRNTAKRAMAAETHGRGISFRKVAASPRRQVPETLENADEKLTARIRRLLDFLSQQWKHLQLQIEKISRSRCAQN